MTILRPELLLLFLLWLPLSVWLVKNKPLRTRWESVVDPELLKALTKPNQKTATKKNIGLLSALAISILAASGPAITHSKTDTLSQGNLIVLLDNSLSMAATDIAPSRIERAKRMIYDWANSGLFQQTGIIVYSASAHWLTPFTSDARTLQLQTEPVTPFIMPEFGNHPERAFSLLNERLAELPTAPLHLLWLTDDIPASKLAVLDNLLPDFSSAFVVPMGHADPTPIPLPNGNGFLTTNDNNVVMVSTLEADIRNAAERWSMRTISTTTQPAALSDAALARMQTEQPSPREIGYWLLLPLALWLFWHLTQTGHPGSVFSITLMLLLFMPPSIKAETLWDKLTLNREQRAYQALIDQQPDQAFTLSQRIEVQAEALFRLGEYEASAALLADGNNASQWFNQGNALAHQQAFEEAISAYEQAITLANHPGAITNKQLLEEFLKQNRSEQEKNKEASDQQRDSQANEGNNQTEDTPSENDVENPDQQPSDNTDDSEPSETSENNPTDRSEESNEETQISPSQESTVNRAEMREQQAIDALLNRVQTEPGRVIQQKFNYQFQQNPVESEGTPW